MCDKYGLYPVEL